MPHIVPTFFMHPARDLAELEDPELSEIEPGSNFWWDLGLGVEVDVWQVPNAPGNWGWSINFKHQGESAELVKYRAALPDPARAAGEAEEAFRALVIALTSIWAPP